MSDQFSRFTLPALLAGTALLAACSQEDAGESASEHAPSLVHEADEAAASVDAKAQVQAPFGAIEVEEFSEEGGSHAAAGRLHVRYLSDEGDVRADFPEAVLMGSWGAMGDWSIRDDLGEFPVIQSEGGGTWQGYSCSWTAFTELAPDGPHEVLRYLDYFSNEGAGRDPLEEFEGELEGPGPDGDLVVRYTGTTEVAVTYRRNGDDYEIVSGEEPQGC